MTGDHWWFMPCSIGWTIEPGCCIPGHAR